MTIILVYIELVGYAVNMLGFIFLFICVFLSVPATAETVYKTTNPDGSVEFTDQNVKDSEEVKIRKSTTYAPTRLPRLSLPTKKLSPTFNYSITINQPANDTALLNQPDIEASISLQPSLKTGYGHQIQYQLAGKSIVSQEMTVTFFNVDRGLHTLSVSIIDKSGEVISSVVSSTLHVKRFFIKPKPPARSAPVAP